MKLNNWELRLLLKGLDIEKARTQTLMDRTLDKSYITQTKKRLVKIDNLSKKVTKQLIKQAGILHSDR